MTNEKRLKEIRAKSDNCESFSYDDVDFLLAQLDLAKAELLGYYRMATAGVWIETEKYGELIKERNLANKRIEVLRTACERISEKGEDYDLDAILDWDGIIDQARIALRASDEVIE